MNPKEKQFSQWLVRMAVILLAVFLAANIVLRLALDDDLTDRFADVEGTEASELKYVLEPEGLITVNDAWTSDGGVYLRLSPTGQGTGQVELDILSGSDEEPMASGWLKILPDHTIVRMDNGNFSHSRERFAAVILLTASFTALLWAAFARSVRRLKYSYYSIFCGGLGLWLIIITAQMIFAFASGMDMMNMYLMLADAPVHFAIYTFPLILVFAVLLTVSNISLIRHERYRLQNMLGILLSAAMLGGFAVLAAICNLNFSGSELSGHIWGAVISFLFCVYAILECFLIGSVLCGTGAARHQPAYDKDCIIILGCMIRKDGTLYPLIRGRVDRAIRFDREQQAATGKRAVFIPSGGQGRNEPMPEAEAMRRYLLEQGIEPERILPETRSVNTRENMLFSSEIVGEGRKAVFATTNYHVFRSGIISRQVGFEPEGMGSPTKWYFWPNAYVREVIGMLSYKRRSLAGLLIPVAVFLTVLRFVF